ncbi:hypothetical protein AXG93_421s1120 [Marchantia polymorpha subsp. ruderalis]|uniref:Uncharacterized protein n=1 Tax=Marchantia polymorpha subsp. ruderalis TaxID=1480154 RepID=A0A176VL67_MARPO|nr:hypothetical protein AXG93_421s1120 [Marchantia polymorpha subsp. ruderalis]
MKNKEWSSGLISSHHEQLKSEQHFQENLPVFAARSQSCDTENSFPSKGANDKVSIRTLCTIMVDVIQLANDASGKVGSWTTPGRGPTKFIAAFQVALLQAGSQETQAQTRCITDRAYHSFIVYRPVDTTSR